MAKPKALYLLNADFEGLDPKVPGALNEDYKQAYSPHKNSQAQTSNLLSEDYFTQKSSRDSPFTMYKDREGWQQIALAQEITESHYRGSVLRPVFQSQIYHSRQFRIPHLSLTSSLFLSLTHTWSWPSVCHRGVMASGLFYPAFTLALIKRILTT